MNVGTKSILFGVHQFLLHPIFVARAWWIIYRRWPKLHEWMAIITHDLGYWGAPNMDGREGRNHPGRAAAWWYHHGDFGEKVAEEILGHSRFHAASNSLPLSKLFQPDKLSAALYPRWLYLILGNLTGEIKEYMAVAGSENQVRWLVETQAHMALMGLQGTEHILVKEQMGGNKIALPEFNAAIDFAIEDSEPAAFLTAWREGDWETLRNEWPAFKLYKE